MIAAVVGAEPVEPDAPAVPARAVELDAVTLDAYGTLLVLDEPVHHLATALLARGIELPRETVERGFRSEVDYYTREHLTAGDGPSLAALRVRCARVFLDSVGAHLDPQEFAAVLAYEYRLLPGVRDAIASLVARGLALAVVANWDFGLHEQLERHGLAHHLPVVVTAAEVGIAKPAATPFRVALERLGVTPARALHVGDSGADRDGAAAAGLRFAPAPLAAVAAALR